MNEESMRTALLASVMNSDGSMKSLISYNFKHFPAPEGEGRFDYNPRLIRHETVLRPRYTAFGEASITFEPSDFDPWSEVVVVRMLGAIYTEGDNSMLAGHNVAGVDPRTFAPYAFIKWDRK